MRVTKEAVVMTASNIADQEGFSSVSLKAVAERLHIRTPSLYNHIAGLEHLLQEAAHKGMREMNGCMTEAVVGYSGEPAIKAAAGAYFRYVIAHPGVYEIIQWAHWHEDQETAALFCQYRFLMQRLVTSCSFHTVREDEILTVLISLLHGYCTMELASGLSDPDAAVTGLLNAIEILLLGLRAKYE